MEQKRDTVLLPPQSGAVGSAELAAAERRILDAIASLSHRLTDFARHGSSHSIQSHLQKTLTPQMAPVHATFGNRVDATGSPRGSYARFDLPAISIADQRSVHTNPFDDDRKLSASTIRGGIERARRLQLRRCNSKMSIGRAGLDIVGPDHTSDSSSDSNSESCPPSPTRKDKRAELRLLFKSLDRDGSGNISSNELASLMPKDTDSGEVRRLMLDLDANGDGAISFAEFEEFFERLTRGQAVVLHALDVRQQITSALTAAVRSAGGVAGFLQSQSQLPQAPHLHYPDCIGRWALQAVLLLVVLVHTLDSSLACAGRGWYAAEDLVFSLSPWIGVEIVLFTLECRLTQRTAQREGWQLLEDPATLTQRYVRGWLTFDVAMILPVDLICVLCSAPMVVVRCSRAPKILRLLRVPHFFGVRSPVADRPKWLSLLIFVFWNLVCLITMAVMWMAIKGEQEQLSETEEVITAVYFIITTLTSVGYGDITPDTVGQRLYVSVVQLVGVLILVYVGAVSTAFILETDPVTEATKDRKRRFAAMIRDLQVPWQLQQQCFTVMPSIIETGARRHSDILSELPQSIKTQIEAIAKVRLLKRVPLFALADSVAMLAIAGSLRTMLIGPGEYVMRKGQQGSEMYIIMHGCVEVLVTDADSMEESCVATLRAGSYFGEVALLRDTTRSSCVRTITACDFFVLDKVPFLQIVSASPDFERALQDELERRAAADDARQHSPTNPLIPLTRFDNTSGKLTERTRAPSLVTDTLRDHACSLLAKGDIAAAQGVVRRLPLGSWVEEVIHACVDAPSAVKLLSDVTVSPDTYRALVEFCASRNDGPATLQAVRVAVSAGCGRAIVAVGLEASLSLCSPSVLEAVYPLCADEIDLNKGCDAALTMVDSGVYSHDLIRVLLLVLEGSGQRITDEDRVSKVKALCDSMRDVDPTRAAKLEALTQPPPAEGDESAGAADVDARPLPLVLPLTSDSLGIHLPDD
eukprot:TRINITY_DN28454_c0_g1_i1.p1 TRINITY_DN28454_c0_g1~~TRINITY_DN28454_c0_g1_i1.p1  ORF type:complete len:981 (+),score=273.62 TRINITY_DN28454_c0_g1_i1:46-2988(+)